MRVNLPDEIVAGLDFSTMNLVDSSFISPELAETFSDVVYRVRSVEHELYVTFLFEHKSAPDKFTGLQVTQYIIDLWRQALQATNQLPVVVPIVFYHGRTSWNYPTNMRELISDYKKLAVFYQEGLPILRHQLIDLRTQDEAFIAQYNEETQVVIGSVQTYFR